MVEGIKKSKDVEKTTTTTQVARLYFRKEHFIKNIQRSDGGRIVASASTMNIAKPIAVSPSEGYLSDNGK